MTSEEKKKIINSWVRQFNIIGVQNIDMIWGRILFPGGYQYDIHGGYIYTPRCHNATEVINTSYDLVHEKVWKIINDL